jgi:hypothetical protein
MKFMRIVTEPVQIINDENTNGAMRLTKTGYSKSIITGKQKIRHMH